MRKTYHHSKLKRLLMKRKHFYKKTLESRKHKGDTENGAC